MHGQDLTEKDMSKLKISESDGASGSKVGGREKTRLTKSTGQSIKQGSGKIGGPFTVSENPAYLQERLQLFESCAARRAAELESKPKTPLRVTLPDGSVKEGTAWVTTPYDIAVSISQGLADNTVVAKIKYTEPVDTSAMGLLRVEDGLDVEGSSAAGEASSEAELWDLTRPLLGSCSLQLLKFDDPEAKAVFWHSSAHMLGQALEKKFGAHLTIGPPVQDGFYYDCYMGEHGVSNTDFKDLEALVGKAAKEKQRFERLVVTKAEALALFKYNAFKTSIISSKIPEGGYTTVYRNGDLIDLCRGPHVPHTGRVRAFAAVKNSGANWLGQTENDLLQRVYGISFPDKDRLKKWLAFQEQAREKDHRRVGTQQELFFFHTLSPGSGFFLTHGARIYQKLVDFIRRQYWLRGYTEVISPNIFNLDLWYTSGHAEHYKKNMFVFDIEGQEFGVKPMNCPGHCLIFGHRVRSHRELPIRMAEFGVLHRNELSGALAGLTRVRRFVQDDAHIFCTEEQVKGEVLDCLDFMKFVYGALGMTYRLELSTKPEKALGDAALWEVAEEQLSQALNEFTGGPEGWRLNPGDGAFYGPKIDIKVFDALERPHQCATIQLDFQLPIRFKLKYQGGHGAHHGEGEKRGPSPVMEMPSAEEAAAAAAKSDAEAATEANEGGDVLDPGYHRPIIVHRAMLGSVERMVAVLTEHFGGKWPFWLSPRQAIVVPVGQNHISYAQSVQKSLHDAGFFVDVNDSTKTLNKKIREGQLAQYNFILVVGSAEEEGGSVNIRTRDNKVHGTKSIAETVDMFRLYEREYSRDV